MHCIALADFSVHVGEELYGKTVLIAKRSVA